MTSIQMLQIVPGFRRPDNYIILANFDNQYVLAVNNSAPGRYVVWSIDQDGDTVNGRYYVEAEAAYTYFANLICAGDAESEDRPTLTVNDLSWEDIYDMDGYMGRYATVYGWYVLNCQSSYCLYAPGVISNPSDLYVTEPTIQVDTMREVIRIISDK